MGSVVFDADTGRQWGDLDAWLAHVASGAEVPYYGQHGAGHLRPQIPEPLEGEHPSPPDRRR